jgi:hypothetical protein
LRAFRHSLALEQRTVPFDRCATFLPPLAGFILAGATVVGRDIGLCMHASVQPLHQRRIEPADARVATGRDLETRVREAGLPGRVEVSTRNELRSVVSRSRETAP